MLAGSEVSKPVKIFLFVLITGVLIISSIIVLVYNDYFFLGDMQKLNNDDVKYINTARVLLNDGTLVYNSGAKPSSFIMPGLPFILAGFMAVFGQDEGGVIAYRLFQCVQQAFSIYLVFWIAHRVFNTRTAIIACIISALYLPDYFSSGTILSETTFRTIVLLLICTTMIALEKRKTVWYIVIGVLVAIAAYFKPHASLYPAVFFVLWWKQNYSWKEIIRYIGVIVAVYILLLLPWWIRNMITFDKFILFTTSGGSPFLLGARIYGALPPEGFFQAYPQYDKETLFRGADSTAVTKGIDVIKYGFQHEPLKYLYWYTIGKWVELYFHPFYSRPIWPISRPIMNVVQIMLMVVNMIGLTWAMIKTPLQRHLPLLITFAYFTVIYFPFVAFNRYGYPNMVLLIIYGAYAIDKWIYRRQTPNLILDDNQNGRASIQ